ncbi:hypothetical protein [Bifidobacterium moraviense]|nr:hypothetical protein [Bifidobacterium sp. DSM 109958]
MSNSRESGKGAARRPARCAMRRLTAAVSAVVMLVTFGVAAGAFADDVVGTPELTPDVTVNAQSSISPNITSSAPAQETTTVPTPPAELSSADASASNAASSPTADTAATQPAPAAVAAANCSAVTTWTELKECVEGATADATVTITASVTDVPSDVSIIVPSHKITIVTAIPANTDGTVPAAIRPAGNVTGDSLFIINQGASLAIGSDANDKFAYSGTAAAVAVRRFATVNNGGVLTVNAGTFEYITVGG